VRPGASTAGRTAAGRRARTISNAVERLHLPTVICPKCNITNVAFAASSDRFAVAGASGAFGSIQPFKHCRRCDVTCLSGCRSCRRSCIGAWSAQMAIASKRRDGRR
jgi:hypothetical protein